MKSLRILAVLPLSILSCITLGMDPGKKRSHQEAFANEQHTAGDITQNDPFDELYSIDFSDQLDVDGLLSGVDDTVEATYLTHSSAGDQENALHYPINHVNSPHAAYVISPAEHIEPLECAGAYNTENTRSVYAAEFTPLFASSFSTLPPTSRYATLSQESAFNETLLKNTAASRAKLFTPYKPIINEDACEEIKESGRNKKIKQCFQKGNYERVARDGNIADVRALIKDKKTYDTIFVDLINRGKGYRTAELTKSARTFKKVYGADSDQVKYAYIALKSFSDLNQTAHSKLSEDHKNFTKLGSILYKAQLVLAILAPDQQAQPTESQIVNK